MNASTSGDRSDNSSAEGSAEFKAPATHGDASIGSVQRFRVGWLAAMLVVGLVLGVIAGLLIPSLRAPGGESAEAGFARDMSLHHSSAVELAMMAYQRSTNADIQNIAYDIATSQQADIGMMRRWLAEWKVSPNASGPRMAWMPEGTAALQNGLMPGMPTTEEMDRYAHATGKDFDILFAQYMLRHHLGGIHMIDGVLATTDRDEVVAAATTMKSTQQKEITELRELLQSLGAAPL